MWAFIVSLLKDDDGRIKLPLLSVGAAQKVHDSHIVVYLLQSSLIYLNGLFGAVLL